MENVVQATDDGATAASRTGTHTTAAPPALLSADRPVTDPQDDQLGYAPFARHLAAGLMKMAPLEGFVVAIHGPWGSGKSTLLNFVRAFLTNESENSGNRPVIVLFNPWWFSGTEALTRHFFAQLQAAMDTDTRLAESLRRKLSGLARLIGKLPVPGREFAEVASTLLEPGQLDVVALKEAVADELRASGVRIVVIVDDIDRLLAEEMREIFRLVKAVGDFPNVTYILAFDRANAAKVLSPADPTGGDAFLEKIVQVSFDLPLPDEEAITALLFERVVPEPSRSAGQRGPLAEDRWQQVLIEGVRALIRTPRDLVRLGNAIQVTYGAVQSEVDDLDFIGLEALRTFSPSTYETIRSNPGRFTGAAGEQSTSDSEDTIASNTDASFHQTWVNTVSSRDRNAVTSIVAGLFPATASALGKTAERATDGVLRRSLRVASVTRFPTYFRMTLPRTEIPQRELRQLADLAKDPQDLISRLTSSADESRTPRTYLVEVLGRLAERPTFFEGEHLTTAVSAVLRADLAVVYGQAPQRFLDPQVDDAVTEFAIALLQRGARLLVQVLDRQKRGMAPLKGSQPPQDFLLKLAREDANLSLLIPVFRGVMPSDASLNRSRVISRASYREACDVLVERIRAVRDSGQLLDDPRLRSTLEASADWGGIGEVRTWVTSIEQSPESLMLLAVAFLDPIEARFDSDAFSRFGDSSQLIALLRDPDDRSAVRTSRSTAMLILERGLKERARRRDTTIDNTSPR